MTNGNEPAMPLNSESINAYQMTGETNIGYGFTKREFIATSVLQGLCATTFTGSPEKFAETALKLTDALIIELNKEKEK